MKEVQELRRLSGMNLKDAVQKVEPMILDTLDKLLAKNEGSLLSTDKCELHGKQCPLHDVGGHSIIGCAGTWTCTDFSRCGAKMKCRGKRIVPYKLFERERMIRKEHWIFGECVAGHPSKILFEQAFGESHEVFSFLMNPKHLGYPYTRQRKMTWCLDKRLIMELEPIFRSPRDMFSAKLCSDASIYFVPRAASS